MHGPGGRIGDVREIYLDDATDRPEWVLVDLEQGSRFVPLAGARIEAETIVVVHGASAVQRAPDYELSKELTQDQERELYDHYDVAGLRGGVGLGAAGAGARAEPEPEPTSRSPCRSPRPSRHARARARAGARRSPTPVATPRPSPPPSRSRSLSPSAVAEPIAALPPEGETSEPEDEGPMIPPRPEPVAPDPAAAEHAAAASALRRGPDRRRPAARGRHRRRRRAGDPAADHPAPPRLGRRRGGARRAPPRDRYGVAGSAQDPP